VASRSSCRKVGDQLRGRIAATLLVSALLVLPPTRLHADDALERRLRIKSAILYHVTKFVRWPNEGAAEEPFQLCLEGNTDLVTSIVSTFSGQRVRGHPIRIVRVKPPFDRSVVKPCHMLFLAAPEPPTLRLTEGLPILSACDVERVAWGGCTVQIFEEANKARLGVDVKEAQKAGLRISTELLGVAAVHNGEHS